MTLLFVRENRVPFTRTLTVPGFSRFFMRVVGPAVVDPDTVPELDNETFGVVVTSDNPIVVERAMYSTTGGRIWSAGTSARAVPLP